VPRIPRLRKTADEAPATDAPDAATAETTAVAPVTAETPGAVAAPPAPAPAPAEGEAVVVEQAPADAGPGFRERTRMRRRLRYLRRLRELLFRDLGGLAFDLHRFGRERPDLLQQKLEVLAGIDAELRTLENALHDRRELTELREAGISACPRCGTLHDTDANFCPACGTSLHGKAPAPPVGEPAPAEQPQAEPEPSTTSS
jgi:hypothetical protein